MRSFVVILTIFALMIVVLWPHHEAYIVMNATGEGFETKEIIPGFEGEEGYVDPDTGKLVSHTIHEPDRVKITPGKVELIVARLGRHHHWQPLKPNFERRNQNGVVRHYLPKTRVNSERLFVECALILSVSAFLLSLLGKKHQPDPSNNAAENSTPDKSTL